MKRLVVGISGATGAIYGIRALELLSKEPEVETHLVISDAGALTIREETRWSVKEVERLADTVYDLGDVGAAIASGSFHTEGMMIVPCSIKSMSMISNSINANLLIRAADVTLKEQKKLLLLVRETPLHLGHLRLLTNLAEMGAVINPPMPAFYNRPQSIDDLVDHTVLRALNQFGIGLDRVKSWTGISRGKLQPIEADPAGHREGRLKR